MTLKRYGLAGVCLAAGLAAGLMTTGVPAAELPVLAAAAQSGGGRGGGAAVVTIQPTPEPAVGPGAISGVVVDGATRQPIGGALVQLSGGPAGEPRPRQMTDRAGRFIFPALPASDTYTVSASHPEYLPAAYNAAPGDWPSPRITVFEAQWREDVNVVLHRPASLAGTVTDERGEPVVGVPVRVLRAVTVDGQARYAAGPVAETDDRGVYRVADLPPGRYLVHVPSVQITVVDGAMRPPVSPQRPLAVARTPGGVGTIVGHFPTPPDPATGRAYAMAFHPAARSAREAVPIALDYGETHVNADVQLTLVSTVRVSGTLAGTPEAIAGMPVWLVPAGDETAGPGGEVAITSSDSAGSFTFLNVPSGQYSLIASRSRSEYSVGGSGRDRLLPERANLFNFSMVGGRVAGVPGVSYATSRRSGAGAYGRMPVVVEDRDLADLLLPLTSGVRVTGHFVWDGLPAPPDGVNVLPVVSLESADRDLSLGFPQSAFTPVSDRSSPAAFTIEGVVPGRYLIGVVMLADGWLLEGADWRGRDLLSSPIDVTGASDVTGVVVRVTARTTRVIGVVRDRAGTPVTGATAVVFPADPSAWEAIGFTARASSRCRSVRADSTCTRDCHRATT